MARDIGWEPTRSARYTYSARPWMIAGMVLAIVNLGILLWNALRIGCPAWLASITIAVTTPLAVCLLVIGICYHFRSHQTVKFVVLATAVVIAVLALASFGPLFLHWLHVKHHLPF